MDPRVHLSRVVAAAGLLLGATLLVSALATPPSARAADVANGRMLAMNACAECHSQRSNPYQLDASKLFAGGAQFEGPWGTVYSRNITPDPETGIGAWTDEEVKRAITEGVSRNGEKLILMPFEHFRGMSASDIDVVVAFLRSLPPVRNVVPADRLAPPAAVAGFVNSVPPLRAAVPPSLFSSPRDVFHDYVANGNDYALPPAPAGFVAPQGRDSVARGGYLVKAVLGCTACHSSNLAGGAPPFFAPNITPDRETGIGAWSKEDIVRLLREGRKRDGSQVSPIMPSAALGYAHLTDDDVYNVIAYLQSVPPIRRAPGQPNPLFGPPPGAAGPPAPSALPATGDALSPWAGAALLLGAAVALGALALRRRVA